MCCPISIDVVDQFVKEGNQLKISQINIKITYARWLCWFFIIFFTNKDYYWYRCCLVHLPLYTNPIRIRIVLAVWFVPFTGRETLCSICGKRFRFLCVCVCVSRFHRHCCRLFCLAYCVCVCVCVCGPTLIRYDRNCATPTEVTTTTVI